MKREKEREKLLKLKMTRYINHYCQETESLKEIKHERLKSE